LESERGVWQTPVARLSVLIRSVPTWITSRIADHSPETLHEGHV
jgi:hypothetical protein